MYNKPIYFLLILLTSCVTSFAQHNAIIAIEDVNVLTMTEEKLLTHQRVLLQHGKVVKIEAVTGAVPEGVAQTINGRGKYLLPGFSEMHYHFRSNDINSDLKLLVANGITTVRNMAASPNQDQIDIRDRTRSGKLLPVNYFTSGPYLQSKDLATEADVQKMVNLHKERGYDFLKIADNLPEDIYLKLLNECQTAQIPVIGHSQRALPVEYSTRMKSIEHIEEFVYLSPERNQKSFFGQDNEQLKKLEEQLKSSGVYIGTTLVGFEFITNCLDDTEFAKLQSSPLKKYLAKNERNAFLTEQNDYRKLRHREFNGQKAVDLFDNYFKWIKKFTGILYENNIPLLSGSDTYGMTIVGFSLHREFELLQECGMRPYDILLAGTVTPARYLNSYAESGTIAVGKNADLVLLDDNPLTDIRNTQKIAGVMVKGQWFDRKKLDVMLKEVEEAYR
jgi:hypothetical protein